jgi:hypothetical protein
VFVPRWSPHTTYLRGTVTKNNATTISPSETIARTQERAYRNQLSLIPQSDCDIVYNELILPRVELELDPAYAAVWLRRYHEHESNPRKRFKSHAYSARCSRLFRFWMQTKLSKDLTATDVFIKYFAPNESTRVLLVAAIAEFGNVRSGRMRRRSRPLARMLFCNPRAISMIMVVARKAGKGFEEDFERQHLKKLQQLSARGMFGVCSCATDKIVLSPVI